MKYLKRFAFGTIAIAILLAVVVLSCVAFEKLFTDAGKVCVVVAILIGYACFLGKELAE